MVRESGNDHKGAKRAAAEAAPRGEEGQHVMSGFHCATHFDAKVRGEGVAMEPKVATLGVPSLVWDGFSSPR